MVKSPSRDLQAILKAETEKGTGFGSAQRCAVIAGYNALSDTDKAISVEVFLSENWVSAEN